MWERLDSRLSPYRTPEQKGFPQRVVSTVFLIVIFLRSPLPGWAIFFAADVNFHSFRVLPMTNQKILAAGTIQNTRFFWE